MTALQLKATVFSRCTLPGVLYPPLGPQRQRRRGRVAGTSHHTTAAAVRVVRRRQNATLDKMTPAPGVAEMDIFFHEGDKNKNDDEVLPMCSLSGDSRLAPMGPVLCWRRTPEKTYTQALRVHCVGSHAQ